MTPQDFVTKWRDSTPKERAGAQEHFIDLCRMLGEKTPGDADAKGDWYTFEKGAAKTGGGRRLGGCLEAQLFCLGIQEQGEES